ncbi:unnamed protein product [Durusdinium trenchii]|uniref:Uncharacterized protein n=1 Tax=Durusdinium trenchii TaxID=1381693 RepID=A0ABP0NVN3_9DINO
MRWSKESNAGDEPFLVCYPSIFCTMDCLEHQASISLCSGTPTDSTRTFTDARRRETLTESLSLLHMQSPVKCHMKLIGLVHPSLQCRTGAEVLLDGSRLGHCAL